VIPTDDLSTGIQGPDRNRINLRRQLCNSLDKFVRLCRCRLLHFTNDPYGDLFVGFEEKSCSVLQSVMNHHGLIVASETKLSKDEMRDSIVSHIAAGHCVQSIGKPRPCVMDSMRIARASLNVDITYDASCQDFVRGTPLSRQEDNTETEIKIVIIILRKVASRKNSSSLLTL